MKVLGGGVPVPARWLATAAAVAAVSLLTPLAARAQVTTWPTFNPIGACAEAEPAGDENPATADLVGAPGAAAAFLAVDSDFLYLRERLAKNPGDPGVPGSLAKNAWVVLVQTANGNPFTYQYLISLDGNAEQVQLVWNAQTTASSIDFDPIFNDPAETVVATFAATTHARTEFAGTDIGGSPNYFIDWAIPRATLAENNIDPETSLYWFATSANANNYNKDITDCPFSPTTTLGLSKSVNPPVVVVGQSTPVVYTITVTNTGAYLASGVVVSDSGFPAWVTINNVSTTAGSVTASSASAFEVRIPFLGIGESAVITVNATANSGSTASFTNTVVAFATNADDASASTTLMANPVTPTFTPTNTPTITNTPVDTATPEPTDTPIPPTDTPVPTDTPIPPTDTPVPTDTPIPPTDTPVPTDTPIPPTDTPVPTDTPIPPTDTPAPPTDTPEPTDTPTPVSVCGDGSIEGDEQCDDGNLIDGDGCDSDCTVSGACGLAPTNGNEAFVGTGAGDDPGCAAAAFTSIQDAIDASADGDTISVCPGVYNEALSVTSELTIRSTDGAGATIIEAGVLPAVDIRRSGTTIDGFTLVSTGVTVVAASICPLASPGCANPGEAGSNVIIRNNVIDDAITGIDWRGRIDCVSIVDNAFADNFQHVLLRQEFLVSTPAVLVEVSNNSFDRGGGAGVGVEVFGMEARMFTNRVSDALLTGVRIGGAVVRWAVGIVERSTVSGIVVEQAPAGTQILESEIVDNLGAGITVGPGGHNARVLNNNIQRNGVGLTNNSSGGTLDATLNYWSSFTGPLHAVLRDFGQGDEIVDVNGGATSFIEFLCDRFPQGFPSEEGLCGAESSTLFQLIPGSWPDITSGKGRFVAFESSKDLDIDPRTEASNAEEYSEAFLLDRYPRRKVGGICLGDPGQSVCKRARDCPKIDVGNGLVLDGSCGSFTQLSDDNDAGSYIQRARVTRVARLITFDRSVDAGVEPNDGGAMGWTRRTFERGSEAGALDGLTSGVGGVSQRANPNLSGRKIVIESTEDLEPGKNSDGNWEIFVFDGRKKNWRQITDTVAPVENRRPELRSGVRIIFDSNGDLHDDPQRVASNADGNREIFSARLASRGGLVITQITDTVAPVENTVGCTARGGKYVFFSSNGDLDNDPATTQTNADGNREIFRYVGSVRKQQFTQLTNSIGGENANAACTPNGIWVAFESTADLDNDGAVNRRIYLMNTKKMSLLRLSRSRFGDNAHPRTTGRMTVWDSNANLTGANPEAERVIYLFDRRKD